MTTKVIENTKCKTLHDFINDNVVDGSTVCTDDFKSYQNIQGHYHQFVQRCVGEYGDEVIHINSINLSDAQRAHNGKIHKISHQHQDHYLQEFSGRQNFRSKDTAEQMAVIASSMVDKRLRYSELIY